MAFLLVALALSIAGSLALWLRHRQPTSLDHGVDEFRREMDALRPDNRWNPPGRG
jgi:hypothetical protein